MLKYISIGLLLVFTSILGGCNLDTDDENKLPGDKFWTGPQANAHAFMLSIYQSLRKATTSNGFFLYSGDVRCAPITGQHQNDYLYLIQNDMKNYKSKKDWNEEGKTDDFGAIYNWKQMYEVVQSANIMIEEVVNIQNITDREVESYRAECRFLRSLAYFLIIRRHILPNHCRVQIKLQCCEIVCLIYNHCLTATRTASFFRGVTEKEASTSIGERP